MGAEKDLGVQGMKYRRVEDLEQSRVEDSCYADNKETENSVSRRSLSALSPPPREFEDVSALKSPSTVILSPKDSKEQNEITVAAATKHFVRQQKRWRATVRAFSSLLRRLSPASALRRARDSYVRSLGNFAGQISSSTACGATYGAGHSSIELPAAFRSGSSRYREESVMRDADLSSAFKESLKETPTMMSHTRRRSLGSIPQTPPLTATQFCRVSSARVYGSSKYAMQPMLMYTIKETS